MIPVNAPCSEGEARPCGDRSRRGDHAPHIEAERRATDARCEAYAMRELACLEVADLDKAIGSKTNDVRVGQES